MVRSWLAFFAFLLTASFSTAYAEVYTWTDDQGTVHFTEDLGAVPKKFRDQNRNVGEIETSPAEEPDPAEPSAKTPEAAPQARPSVGNVATGTTDTFAGKTYDEWTKDLGDREAALTSVRKQIDEVAAKLNNAAGDWDDKKKLMAEHKMLVSQFKEMKAQYFQQVEKARKAGLQVNIQQ